MADLEKDYDTFKNTDLSITNLTQKNPTPFILGMALYKLAGIDLEYNSLPRKYRIVVTAYNVPIDAQMLALKILDLPENLFSELNKTKDIDRAVKDIINKVKLAHQTRGLQWHPDKLKTDSDKEKGQALMIQTTLAKDLLIYQLELKHANYRKYGYLPWHLTGFNNLKNILDVILWPTKREALTIYGIIKNNLINATDMKGSPLNKKEKLVLIIQSLKWPLILAIPTIIILILLTALLSPLVIIPFTMALVKLAPLPIILSVKLIQTIVSMIKSFMHFTASGIKACMDFTVSALKTLSKYFDNNQVSPVNTPLITYYDRVPTGLTAEPIAVAVDSKAADRQPTPYSYRVELYRSSPRP